MVANFDILPQLYQEQGQYAKAEPLYQRVLKIFEKALGPNYPPVANALEGYADLLNKTGHAKEAASLPTLGEQFGINLRRRMVAVALKSEV